MKVHAGGKVAFVCNDCKMIAGKDSYEDEALKRARETAKDQGWEWKHPGWQLYCSSCK